MTRSRIVKPEPLKLARAYHANKAAAVECRECRHVAVVGLDYEHVSPNGYFTRYMPVYTCPACNLKQCYDDPYEAEND